VVDSGFIVLAGNWSTHFAVKLVRARVARSEIEVFGNLLLDLLLRWLLNCSRVVGSSFHLPNINSVTASQFSRAGPS